jgi:hypothetical protein
MCRAKGQCLPDYMGAELARPELLLTNGAVIIEDRKLATTWEQKRHRHRQNEQSGPTRRQGESTT